MSKHKVRRHLTELNRARARKNAWYKHLLAGFKRFAKLRRKQIRHRLATELRCPVYTRWFGDVVACQLPNGHEGVCLDLDGRAMYTGPVLTPETRYEFADRLFFGDALSPSYSWRGL